MGLLCGFGVFGWGFLLDLFFVCLISIFFGRFCLVWCFTWFCWFFVLWFVWWGLGLVRGFVVFLVFDCLFGRGGCVGFLCFVRGGFLLFFGVGV